MAEAVVRRPLLRVREHLVRLVDLLEALRVAPSFLLRSGWYSSASFLNAFFSSSSEQPREMPRTS